MIEFNWKGFYTKELELGAGPPRIARLRLEIPQFVEEHMPIVKEAIDDEFSIGIISNNFVD